MFIFVIVIVIVIMIVIVATAAVCDQFVLCGHSVNQDCNPLSIFQELLVGILWSTLVAYDVARILNVQ